MRNILFCVCLYLLNPVSFAQQNCPIPDSNVVIFFGNGINTRPESADASLRILKRTLGDTYNGQTLRYDLAYNRTSGIALDLAQSVAQAGAQFSSQMMGWFNNIGVAPNWFNQWYQRFVMATVNVVADEVADHVDKYAAAIRRGQKVVVVAHSQGNFYVNEAKVQLALQLDAGQMQSFAIFGVAVPSNNVGGNSGPYYTNHQDFIQYVPAALPQNWTLQRSNGTSADDVGLIQAHLFNDTYMSTDFDIRPALLLGIKTQINSLQSPSPSCDDYWRHQIAFFQGSYKYVYQGTPKTLQFNADGTVNPVLKPVIDYTGSPRFTLEAGALNFGAGAYTLSAKRDFGAISDNATWSGDGQFVSSNYGCESITGPVLPGCAAVDFSKPTYLKNRKLTEWMLIPAQKLRAYLYCGAEVASPVPGVIKGKRVWLPVSVVGTTIVVNGLPFDIAANATTEGSRVENTYPRLGATLPNDPTITLNLNYGDSTHGSLTYSWSRGLRFFTMFDSSGSRTVDCWVDPI